MSDRARSSEEAVRARQQAAVAGLGLRALAGHAFDALLDDAVGTLVRTLDLPMCGLLEALPEPNRFTLRAGAGWLHGELGAVLEAEEGSAVRFMLGSRRPVVYTDLAAETRFRPPSLLVRYGVRSGMGVMVPGVDRPWGVLGVHATERRDFTPDDANFLQSIANVLARAIERARATDELRAREERFRLLAENAQDIVYRYRLGPEPAYEYVSSAVERILGYSPADYYADPAFAARIVHPDDRRLVEARDAPEPIVMRVVRRDGRTVWLEVRNVPIRSASGAVIAVEGVARDVTAQKDAEDELRRAYEDERAASERLRALDEMKNAFLYAVSHELRTPLTNILGITLTLRNSLGQLTAEEQLEVLVRLTSNARKLERLLADLLDVDRLRRGVIEPRRSPTPLGALVRRVVRETDVGARRVTVEGDDTVAMVDAAKVERIVENLLANAARHTPSSARIWVRIAPLGEAGATIAVEDDGPGVAEHLRRAIFEPFRRGERPDPSSPGTGIGLSLVALFAELHGGRAWVEDRPGGGARFLVELPF